MRSIDPSRAVRGVDQPQVATYELDANQSVLDGLTTVFASIGYDLRTKEPELLNYVDPEAVDQLRETDTEFTLTTSIWQHPVRFTTDEIIV